MSSMFQFWIMKARASMCSEYYNIINYSMYGMAIEWWVEKDTASIGIYSRNHGAPV